MSFTYVSNVITKKKSMDLIYLKLHKPEYKRFVQRVQRHLNLPNPTIKDFRETGLVMPPKEYESVCGEHAIHHDCTSLIWYALGAGIVQHLKSGVFYVETEDDGSHVSPSLKEAEEFLFNSQQKQFKNEVTDF